MEAGTSLSVKRRWGVLVVIIKKPKHTAESSGFIGGDVLSEKSFINCD